MTRLACRLAVALMTAALAGGLLPAQSAEPPRVVASIKPLHSLAAAVMAGVRAPELLVRGAASPHGFSLRPSDAARLDGAAIVFWSGPALETYLEKPLSSLADDAMVMEVAALPGLTLLPPREGGVWEAHENVEAHAHEAGGIDPHLWLDPENAQVIASAMAERLAAADPANAAAYRANAAALSARIEALDAEIAALLAPVRDRPFVVFHDAYQYFEAQYGLAGTGAITVSPDQPPGARRLREIRAAVAERGAVCLFREPGFDPALVALVAEGSALRQAELDPEGIGLAEGPDLYLQLMRGLARGIADCLAADG